MLNRLGTTLQNGKYCIEEELGHGGGGITYRATQIPPNRNVVIKTPDSYRLNKDPRYRDYVKQFKKEAESLGKLPTDAHLVQIYDFFEEDSIPYLVMDFIEGEDLFKVVDRRGGQIPEAEAVEWICTIVQALLKVYEVGLVHRDLQPANIMIRPNGQPVVIDFGIAHNIQPLSQTTICSDGNEGFAPYEQLRKKSRDPKVDVYTLAATLYFILTGKAPESSNERHFDKAKITKPKAINPAITDRTNRAILAGMAFYPDERPDMEAWLKILMGDRKPPLFSRRKLIQYGALSAGAFTTIVIADQINKALRRNDRLPLFLPGPPEPLLTSLSLQTQTFQSVTLDEFGKNPRMIAGSNRYLEEDLGNGIRLKMALISGGSFMMGSPDKEALRSRDEGPVHAVKVPDFFMGELTITQAQWQAIAQLPQIRRALNPDPATFGGKDRPIERVSWNEALEFCDRLAKKTNRPYRLPSEAEWEYACRAGTTMPFHLGPTITTDFANYRGTDDNQGQRGQIPGNYDKGPKGAYRGQTVVANEFPPNAFGLHNMHGNVWEWCMDNWHGRYENAPIDGSAWLDRDADATNDRVIRGGSWNLSRQYCRSAFRNFFAPGFRFNNLGFRVMFRPRPQDS